MDPSHRGWPPPGGNQHGGGEQGQSQGARPPFGSGGQQASPPQTHPNLPPPNPGAPFPPFNQQPPPSLAGIASLSQSSPRQPQPSAGRPEGPGLPLPGFGHATGQPAAAERERERAREQEQIQIKEEEDRRREQQERQRFEQAPPHQGPPGPPMPLHQPVAVGPRTALGPNGVLNNPLPSGPQPQQPQPQLPMGAPSGPANIFGGGAVQPANQPQGQQGGQQQMQQGMLMPFAPGGQPQQGAPQQQPQGQQGQQQQGQGQGQGQQPILNDALSYLDQVKVQFSDQPDVYNRFLDIMKDFKSGAIDTPGVIGRVSSLFAGNPELIQGFNTFLPSGYRIECGADNDPNSIRVTTPMGVSFHKMPPQRPLSQQGNAEPFGRTNGTFTPQPGQQSAQMTFSPSGRPLGPAAQGQQPQHLSPEATRQEQQAMHQQQERGLGSLQNAVSAAAGGAGMRAGVSPRGTPMPGQQDPGAGGQDGGMEKRGPVEFNHAISYVNKIKNRFSAQPDVYKQFLEILQTYQRESKPIQEVYSQVTRLFNGAQDLLEDFKQFLPESAAQAKEAERARQRAEESAMMSNVRNEAYQSPVMSREPQIGTPSHARGNLPPVGNFAPTPNYKDNKRKRGGREGTVGSANEGAAGPNAGKTGGYGGQQSKRLKQSHPQPGAKTNDQPPLSPTLIPPLPAPIPPTTTSAATHDELQLFDRAKKFIGNKNTMTEFLKLCNLFTQDLIDRSTLIFRMQSFIGGNADLLKAFRDWIGHDERDVMHENRAREPMVPGGRISLSNCRGLGPSYRLLPKRERVKTCSGRDELCNSVLNDEWASHPTWASEDSGFIAHRKNVHEEGLHRIEEERHDYDLNIEACSRTIQLLEPFAAQLQRMSSREAQGFKLPEKLGGQSDTIYKRVIMKCYGRERGAEVVGQLHDMPAQVLPVLLNRLKERLESWKMAQREWEKVWREQTQRMFWKSLDHQAANAKITDRRQFQTKALQSEIQVKYEEAKQEENKNMGSMAGKAQLEMKVDDLDVVVDTTYLLLVHLEAQGSTTENPRLAPFVKEFVPSFFRLDAGDFETRLRQKMGGTPTNGDAAHEPMGGADEVATEKRGRKSVKGGLHRQMFDKKNKGGRMDSQSASRASTPDVASNAGDAEAPDVEMAGTPAAEDADSRVATSVESQSGRRWLDHPANENTIAGRNVDPNVAEKRHVYRLWANTSLFCFVRMFMTLYDRLLKLKENEATCRETVANASKLKPSNQLGIQDKMPHEFFADTSPGANYYGQMLRKFVQVLDGEIEFNAPDSVEEILRRFYLQNGYPLYALEKIVVAMARYGTQVVSQEGGNKEKSWDILQAWYKHGRKEEVGAREMTDYRRAVEKMIGSGGEGYGVDWDDDKKLVRIFLWKKDDPYFSGEPHSSRDVENAWRYYIASYTSIDDTASVDRSLISPVLLLRNLHAMGADPKADTFPLSFNSGSLDASTDADISASIEANANDSNNTNTSDATSAAAAGNKLLTRFLATKNTEALTLRIAVNNYHSIFTPNTAEAFFMPEKERVGEGVDGEEVEGEREGLVRERFVLMNEGMKGLRQEDVERRSGGFDRLVNGDGAEGNGEGAKAEGEQGEVGEDVEMEG